MNIKCNQRKELLKELLGVKTTLISHKSRAASLMSRHELNNKHQQSIISNNTLPTLKDYRNNPASQFKLILFEHVCDFHGKVLDMKS